MSVEEELYLCHPEAERLTGLKPGEIELENLEPEYQNSHGELYLLEDTELKDEAEVMNRILEERPGRLALVEGPIKEKVENRIDQLNVFTRLQYGETVLENLEQEEIHQYLSETCLEDALVVKSAGDQELYRNYIIANREEPAVDLRLERNQGFTRTPSD